MGEHPDIRWSSQLETLIAQEGEKARGLAYIHNRCEQVYNNKNNYLTIPIIVLSTLAGTASVGSSTLFPDDTKVGSIIIGLISISVGVMNTINSFFSFAKKAEAHRIAYLQYSKLFSNISIELSLPREERQEPEQILKQLRETMERLAETTPSPLISIIEEFNKKFQDKYPDVAKPSETNGLQKIVIFRSPSMEQKMEDTNIPMKINPMHIDGSQLQFRPQRQEGAE